MGIRDAIKDLTGRLKSASSLTADAQRQANDLRRDIELAKRRREVIRSAPGHRDDVTAMLAKHIEARRAEYLETLGRSLKVFRTNAVAMTNPAEVRRFCTFVGLPGVDVSDSGQRPVDARDVEGVITGLLGDQLVPLVQKAVAALPWPEEGIRLADRDELMRKADQEVLELEKQLKALMDAAEEAGITLELERHF